MGGKKLNNHCNICGSRIPEGFLSCPNCGQYRYKKPKNESHLNNVSNLEKKSRPKSDYYWTIFSISFIALILFSLFSSFNSNPGTNINPLYEMLPEIEKDLKFVCDGSGSPEAMGFNLSSQTHLITFYLSGSFNFVPVHSAYPEVSVFPKSWQPNSTNQVELVLCISEQWTTVETCQYESGSFEKTLFRRHVDLTLDLRDAKSGLLLGTRIISGDGPDECPDSISTILNNRDIYYNDHPSISEVIGTINTLIDEIQ